MELDINLMEKEAKKIQFKVQADDKIALERAIYYINLQSRSDYKLINHVSYEVGIGTIEVSEENINPEFLFMMGAIYKIYCKKLDLNNE